MKKRQFRVDLVNKVFDFRYNVLNNKTVHHIVYNMRKLDIAMGEIMKGIRAL